MTSPFDQFKFPLRLRDAHLTKISQSPENEQKILNWCKNPKNIFYFCGNAGTGKSYFASAFYNYLEEIQKRPRVYSEQHFFSELKICMHLSDWEPAQRIRTICETEYIIFDDLGSATMTEWQKEMLFNFLDIRYGSGLPTLITSNLSKSDLKETFHERFVSRIYDKGNVVIELNGEDRRQQP